MGWFSSIFPGVISPKKYVMEIYQKHLVDFDAHLTLKNFSKATRSAYGCALGQFFAYREKQGFQGDFTQEQARSYILYRYQWEVGSYAFWPIFFR